MNNYIEIFLTLMMVHYLCDFSLQNDFVAKFKSYIVDGKYNPIWYHCLTAHCAIHALGVYVLTKSVYLSLFMFFTHFLIDHLKCKGKITFNGDQLLHVLVITVISFIFVGHN